MGFNIENNYGDNYVIESGATVVAGGADAALMRKEAIDALRREAEDKGVSFTELLKRSRQEPEDVEETQDDVETHVEEEATECEKIMELPIEVVEWVRRDARATNSFVKAICGLENGMGKGADDICWNHVKQVLEDLALVSSMKRASFGKFIHKINGKVTESSIKSSFSRKNCYFEDSENGRIKVASFKRWNDSYEEKPICERVAAMFADVIALRPKS